MRCYKKLRLKIISNVKRYRIVFYFNNERVCFNVNERQKCFCLCTDANSVLVKADPKVLGYERSLYYNFNIEHSDCIDLYIDFPTQETTAVQTFHLRDANYGIPLNGNLFFDKLT